MPDVQNTETPGTDEFRRAMGLFTTGVGIVAVDAEPNGFAAMTINSFVSVSLDPMLVCWSLHNDSSQFDLYANARRFAVSILAAEQGDLALRYATRGGMHRFGEDFERSAGELPIVAGSLAHFECRNWSITPAGDHTLILGEVEGLSRAHADAANASPLTFFQGEFCSIAPQ